MVTKMKKRYEVGLEKLAFAASQVRKEREGGEGRERNGGGGRVKEEGRRGRREEEAREVEKDG